MPAFDEILVSNLVLNLHVGVTEKEQAHAQRLTVSLTIRPVQNFTGLEDRIENTGKYSAGCAAVRAGADRRPPRRLIETVASEIAEIVLTGFPVASVDVELRKFVLADTDYVGVRLTRHRAPEAPSAVP